MATESIPLLAVTSFFTIGAGLVVLLIAYYQARIKKLKNHKLLMLTAAVINAAFLVQYITRFLTSEETPFHGPEVIRNFVYFPILAVHILTAIITIGLVLTHLKRSLDHEQTTPAGQPLFEKPYRMDHRSFGKVTFYFWLTSFVGGIIIFLMLYIIF